MLLLPLLLLLSAHVSAQSIGCTLCMDAMSVVDSIIIKYGDDAIHYIEPICFALGPYLNIITGHHYCDPVKLPQTCVDLCIGMLDSWGPLLVDVYVSLALDPAYDCGRIGLCPAPNNSVPVFPKTKLSPSGKFQNPQTGSIFHVSDIHFDRNYVPGTRTDCGMPVCCHSTYGPGNPGGGIFGDYNCDVPEVLVKGVLNQLKVHQPNYLVYTGDSPAHDLWLQTHETNVGAIKNITDWTLAALPAVTKYFPVLGNHAGAPVDNFGGPGKDFWLYGPVGDMWSAFLPKDSIVSFKWGGYYVANMEPGLWAVGLQSNYYDGDNQWLSKENPDIAGQMAWLDYVLSQIASFGEKAYIIAHEKPSSFTSGPWQKMYLTIFTRYQSTIIAHLYGHNHCDYFQVLHDPESAGKVPVGVLFMPSSLTPVGNTTNPSYRVFDYSQNDKSLLDYRQYRLDLPKANRNGFLSWDVAYTAKTGYGVKDFTPASWQAVGERIGTDVNAWHFFVAAYHGGVEYYPSGDIDTNQTIAMCTALGDTDETWALCTK